jgi:hypothetical protein
MPHAITQDAGNSDHSTAPSLPNNGETGTWWSVYEAFFQQLADRTLALFQGSMSGDGTASKTVSVRLHATFNTSSRFTAVDSSNHQYYQQTDVTSAGGLKFPLEPLPPGAKIISVKARFAGTGHSALPATLPKITLYEVEDLTDTEVVTATDAPANVAAYEVLHTLSATANVVVDPLKYYHVKFEGETGANAEISLDLVGIFVELGPP